MHRDIALKESWTVEKWLNIWKWKKWDGKHQERKEGKERQRWVVDNESGGEVVEHQGGIKVMLDSNWKETIKKVIKKERKWLDIIFICIITLDIKKENKERKIDIKESG